MALARTHRSRPTPEFFKAVAHPLRRRILLAFNENVTSPSRVADELGEPIGRVSHHVRVLVRLGAIEPVRTRHRRGAVEHFYRATMPALSEDATGPASATDGMRAAGLAPMIQDVRAATAAGGFDHPRAHVSYTLLDLDEERLDQVDAILADARRCLSEAHTAAAKRLARSGEEPIRTQVAVLYFSRD